MDLDGPDADLEVTGDLPIGEPLRNQPKDFTLSRRQRIRIGFVIGSPG